MNQNLIKGMLIILVMFDHNEFAHQLFPGFLQGFAFHVLAFLALPFLRSPEPLSRTFFQKLLFRYYYPFFLIACAMAVLTMVLNRDVSARSVGNLLLALYSGNNDILKRTTQMALLWFLPSLISVLLLRSFLGSMSKTLQMPALALLVIAHFFVGTVAAAVRDYLPLGLLPAIYAVPLCCLLALVNRAVCDRLAPMGAVIACTCLFLVVKWLQLRWGLSQELGFALVSDYAHPLDLLINDLEAVSGALMLFQLSRLKLPALLERCGHDTLAVYLIHPFVALIIYKASEKWMPQASLPMALLVSMALTIVLSFIIATLAMRMRWVRRFCFPKDYATFAGRRRATFDRKQERADPEGASGQ